MKQLLWNIPTVSMSTRMMFSLPFRAAMLENSSDDRLRQRQKERSMSPALKNTFSWSVSRDNVLRECPRKYWFNYYGHWGGWLRDAPRRTREIYVLKQLKNRATWVGQTVHDCIARTLQNISRGVPVLGVDEILSITRNVMRQDYRHSQEQAVLAEPEELLRSFRARVRCRGVRRGVERRRRGCRPLSQDFLRVRTFREASRQRLRLIFWRSSVSRR